MFTDLVGSTALLADLGEEAADELRDSHFGALRVAVHEHGGDEVKTLGDGVMAVFDSISASVACAVSMQQRVEVQNRRGRAPAIGVRIGVHAGEPIRRDGDFFGTPVVVAKRLCDAAEGGQILCSGLVAQLAVGGGDLAFHDRGPLRLKGIPQPVQTFEVGWGGVSHPVPFPPRLAMRESDSFVGRTKELSRLDALRQVAPATSRRVVFIGGEPGIGKTSLAARLARRAFDDGWVVLYGRCDENLDVPYEPFSHALRQFVRAHAGERLARGLGSRHRELARLVPEIRAKVPGLEFVDRSPAPDRQVLFTAIEEWLAAAAQDEAVLLVLDDLQWATRDTLGLLRHLLVADIEGVMLVGTYRSTEAGGQTDLAALLADAWREPGVDSVVLEGLGEDAVAQYVRATASAAGTGVDARDVHVASGGNPFFMTELVAHILDSADNLTRGPSELPRSVRDVLQRRVARLSHGAQRLLNVASVVGPEFRLPLVERVLGDGDALAYLDEVLGSGLVVELPRGACSFAHALVRQALYAAMSSARRVRIHRLVGEAIETGPHPDSELAALAYHFAAAVPEVPVETAATYGLRAGRAALGQLAFEGAVTQFESALDLADLTAHDLRAELLLGLAESQLGLGELTSYKATAAHSGAEAKAAGSPIGLARAAILYGSVITVGSTDPLMRELPEQAIAALGQSEPALRSLALAHLASEHSVGLSDTSTGGPLAKQAVKVARECDDPVALGTALHALATSMTGSADLTTRLAVMDEADAIWARLHAPLRVSGVGWGYDPRLRAGIYLERGSPEDLETAVTDLERSGAERRDWFAVAFAKSFRSLWLLALGRFAEAEVGMADMLAEGGQHPDIVLHYGAQWVWLLRERGKQDEVAPILRAEVEHNAATAGFRAGLALVLAELGREDEARDQLEIMSTGGFPAIPQDNTWKLGLCLLAEACALLRDTRRAEAIVEHLLPYTGQLAGTGWGVLCVGSVDRYLGMLFDLLDRHADADLAYRGAAHLENRVGARPFAARTCLWHGRALLRRPDAVSQDEARRLLHRGQAIARELGMTRLHDDVTAMAGAASG